MSQVLFVDASGRGSTLAMASRQGSEWRWDAIFSRPETAGTIDFLRKSYSLCMQHSAITAIEGVIVGQGPGSFTGIKIGLAFAYGLCAAKGLPMAGVSTMEMIANQLFAQNDQQPCILLTKATKQAGYFCQKYQQSASKTHFGKLRINASAIHLIRENGEQIDLKSRQEEALYLLDDWIEMKSLLNSSSIDAKPIGHFDAESLALDGILVWLEKAWPAEFGNSRIAPKYLREPAPVEN